MTELSEHFNKMIYKINILMKDNQAKQKALVETELAMLQAQINPHFLYNTLNSIRWLAIINNQKPIKNVVESLSVTNPHKQLLFDRCLLQCRTPMYLFAHS